MRVTIRNRHLAATIAAKGAELISLIPKGGADVVWSADPSVWGWHAPNLFPIVGKLADDTLVHEGRRYGIKQHGFLRHSLCQVVAEEAETCAFQLSDTDETRTQYPFAFELTIAYRLEADRLVCEFRLRNPAPTPLYASLGAHPAFHWPLGDAPRDAHVVLFDQPEPAPIRVLAGGLINPEPRPTPVVGRVLHLDDALFNADALIFDQMASRKVTFGATGGPAVEMTFTDFPYFGIWSKPGPTPFLCLEPWQGIASQAGFTGEFSEKPGVVMLAPDETRSWLYSVRILAAFPG